MRILLINKFHYLRGGSEKYYFELAQLLQENGHQVAFFSMEDPKNKKTNCKEYFVKAIDLNKASKLKAFDIIYSRANKRKMKEALEDFQPDIVHLNNFQRQLSASIVDAIKEKNIPIVFTMHDAQAICPNITMLDPDKKICQECSKGKYRSCIQKKCVKNSRLKSILGVIEARYYDIRKIYEKKMDFIITPSQCYRQKLIEKGISPNKIANIYNFIDVQEYDIETKDEDYALYIGRLTREKGIFNLVQAFAKTKKGNLSIAGEGEEKETMKNRIKEKQLQNRIQLLGYLEPEEIKETIRKCKFVIVPSIGYENCPYSILEALAMGKPVIGANIGGIPELIKEGENGLIYTYDHLEELTDKINKLFHQQDLVEKLGKSAKEKARKLYAKQEYYDKIIAVYKKLIKEKQIRECPRN